MIEAFIASREVLGPNGFFLWGALIRVNGVVTWSAADSVGRGPLCSLAKADCAGVREIIKRLQELRAQSPDAAISLFSDSEILVGELRGRWQTQRNSPAALDECVSQLLSLVPLPDLRYCSRKANPAQGLITRLCERHGVREREMDGDRRTVNASERKSV